MVDTIVAEAYTTVQDSLHRLATFSVRVSVADGQAFVAAADDAARLATDVGTLLGAVEDLFLAGDPGVFERGVKYRALNDGFTAVDPAASIYNSNKINVSYSSVVAGITRNFTLSIPQRDPAEYTVDGNVITQGLADAIDVFVTELSDTGLGVYGGAISPVMVLTVNDE